MPPGRARVRRVLVLVGVTGGHVIAWLGLATVVCWRGPGLETEAPLQVRWLLPPQELPPANGAPAPRPDRPPAARSPSAPALPRAPAAHSPTGSTAPRVDWSGEAARIADEAARAPGAVPTCEPSGRPDSKLPPCPARGKAFDWRREPRPVEFSGGLPYVRLGKRCVVGLGFFGCAVGKLPEANGELFDAMRDPDRERSSVPDVPR